ncbi:hypothetical protein HNO88_002800 [Novosphingobium chloroacetimidivorans]|uniref:DUF6950 domain-containing protein n=1 Tax=Novosphingobium chloroacetimidivorans TaxID=1428314 RepID=A0A7W7KBK4_9SPHN|nr:hypothetical protein [Novosphingobium chloroacetimidivorans]MBB4859471.1 hypothetical protein [Novosphingobium chloroacetimidivorans]
MKLLERVQNTQKTIDEFYGQPFSWGSADCAILAARHLENMGFETVREKARNYTTEIGARRAMTALGCASMEDFVDQYGFARIPPASALPGDLVGFPGGEDERPWTALGVMVDSGEHLIGFANGEVMRGPSHVCTVAWRVA